MHLDEFIFTVKKTLQANIPLEAEFLVADVGLLLKARNGLDWTQFGFVKLGDLLRFLSEQKFLTIAQNAKQALVIKLHDVELDGQSVIKQLSTSARLESRVWHAFTNENLTNERYLNKETGNVWSLPGNPPDVESGKWLKVEPISSVAQKEWVEEFLSNEGVTKDAEIEASLAESNWYTSFPICVNRKQAGTSRRWNAFRSSKVVGHVLNWAEQNEVDRELILFHSTPKRFQPGFKKTNRSFRTRNTDTNDGDLRSALLNAIQQMSDEELLEVSIPARYLVKSLRPELL